MGPTRGPTAARGHRPRRRGRPGAEPEAGARQRRPPYDYIDTIIIVEMENRSFDHYFGSLTLAEGRSDVEGLRADMANLTKGGTRVPVFACGPHWVVDPDPPHGHAAALAQWADGDLSGFVSQYEGKNPVGASLEQLSQVMGYHLRAEVPALYGLADAYTLCDHWHCGLLGPTWPNRFYSHAATSDGLTANLAPLSSPTIYSRVMAAGLGYGVYHRSPIYFALTLLDPASGSYPSNDMDQFFVDAAAGTLLNVTVIEPDYGLDDDHPPHDVRLGQAFIQSIYQALRQSPQWDRCLMLVFYDEHGGFFDHVPPPVPAAELRSDFQRMGFRVPGLVIGPLARRGHVFHDVVEHSSVPGLIARVFQLDHVNERARLAGDFAGALDLELTLDAKRPPPPELPPLTLDAARIDRALRSSRFHQEELEAFGRSLGLRPDSPDEQRRKTERYLAHAARIGAVRIS
ncbi:MAG: alkaline phosphatase family protein [Myxococcota bacterium]